jgi:histidyl-tRNA synthetase
MPLPMHFQSPTGTRDFYPADFNRRRFIVEAWRTTSVRHGFDEIDGPTFEALDLYTAKSGPGIVSQLFAFKRAGGEKEFALRPEFTPTLARMYAEHAGSLPKPTKWFWTQNCFRAERPQRGRLREFWQWNCDVIGDPSPQADAEVIACCVALLEGLGLKPIDVRVKISNRAVVSRILTLAGVAEKRHVDAFDLLDLRGKVTEDQLIRQTAELGLDLRAFDQIGRDVATAFSGGRFSDLLSSASAASLGALGGLSTTDLYQLADLSRELEASGLLPWCDLELSIVRGLAYYTGMVFEVHEASGNERAVAGGGRYDNLIATFGGPPTPAVGFGMGDAVLALVLSDRNLMPDDRALAGSLGLRPDVFVISNGKPESDAMVSPALALLRRAGLHARRSYRATRNIGKLFKEASDAGARFAAVIESTNEATLKDLDAGTQETVPVGAIGTMVLRARKG